MKETLVIPKKVTDIVPSLVSFLNEWEIQLLYDICIHLLVTFFTRKL